MQFNIKLIFLFAQIGVALCVHERLKRFLLFPRGNPTRVQLIGGIGIPVDLNLESVTIGYVLKAQYFLPYNITQLKPQYIEGFGDRLRNARTTDGLEYTSLFANPNKHHDPDFAYQNGFRSADEADDKQSGKINAKITRWHFYKAFEMALNSNGLSGKICLLRAICEAAASPFVMGNENTLFDEILHIFFTPSTSKDPISNHFDNEYFRAEDLGRTNAPCHRVFRSCTKSPLDIISSQFHLHSDEE